MNKPLDTKDERMWAMFCHLASLAGYVFPAGSIVGPLIVWLIKKDESSFVDAHGKEAVNFQLTVLIGVVISIVLAFVIIGFFLLIAIAIGSLVLTIIAAMKANSGEPYRYPMTIRFIN